MVTDEIAMYNFSNVILHIYEYTKTEMIGKKKSSGFEHLMNWEFSNIPNMGVWGCL